MISRLRRNPNVASSLIMMMLFAGVLVLSLDLPETARLFPVLASSVGIVLSLGQLLLDFTRAWQGPTGGADLRPDDDLTLAQAVASVRGELLWLAGLLLAVWLIGPIIAPIAYVVLYVGFSRRYSWARAAILGAGFGVFLLGVFGLALGTAWLEPKIEEPQRTIVTALNQLRVGL